MEALSAKARCGHWVLIAALAGCGGQPSAPNTGSDATADALVDAETVAETATPPGDSAVTVADVMTDRGSPAEDGSVPLPDGGGFCCVPSPVPACCMNFGGWTSDPRACGQVCDGFRPPTQLVKDSHGCDVWTGAAGGVCGAPDGGTLPDASTTDGSTSDANPPGCPVAYGTDGGACPTTSSCRYPQGLCDCESNYCGGAQLPDASFRSVWTCVTLDPSCPPSPTDGGACTSGVTCSYGYCCAPTIQCGSNAMWQSGVGFCPP